ncbi:hypothetical protein Taro_044925 [Colocasia esculenta]|uniref:Uncharacterized protein n=1 Tax=Colocasia esculenta TaxID=4460 RepID=A0A843WN33_COLES|nr:hypothetical protein [Colocasia esculenta]
MRTSHDVTSGRSSRPRHFKVLYFPHRHLWIMEYSCKVGCKPCRRRVIPRQHSRHSWRLRYKMCMVLHVLEFWPKASLASISIDVDVVSVSTIWTPTLTPASSDVDANFSDLHALQSQEFPGTSYPNHWGAVSNVRSVFLHRQELGVNALDAEIPGVVGDTPLEETVESDSERGE